MSNTTTTTSSCCSKSKPIITYWVDSPNSPEFTHLTNSLSVSSLISLDAEWKPRVSGCESTQRFPSVLVLQIACWLVEETKVYLIDMMRGDLVVVLYGVLNEVFLSENVVKVGFRFKQDFLYLSNTFLQHGCLPGFLKVEPFLDITTLYHHLNNKQPGKKIPKQNKSLATICQEVLGISISKELQCSDWSLRPLTEEQKAYAATDAHCLLEILNAFQMKEESILQDNNELGFSHLDLGLKEILEESTINVNVMKKKVCGALDMIQASMPSSVSESSLQINSARREASTKSFLNTIPMDYSLLRIVRKYGDKLVLDESDRIPKKSKKKSKRKIIEGLTDKDKHFVNIGSWQGPPPWDLSLGGDGCPKFLCDVMVEGLAKHLRCIGIDAAVPNSKRPETRDLISHAEREKRVILTRDTKLMRHEYLIKNQIYRMKSLLKNEQLLEVIETFHLKINEHQLLTRCTKCNGNFIKKPLTTGEAVEAAKGFQVIPNCLFNQNLEFWQCMDCNQLYWQGTQYHNALQKFIDICKLQT